MKTVGILLPCYDEKDNVREISNEIIDVFNKELPDYEYKIVFIDNASTDGTVDILRQLCSENNRIAAIFNARNFSYYSSWYGIRNTPGDCVIQIPSDRQVPVSVIPQMVHEWEKGNDYVCAIKTSSEENRLMWLVRRTYYAFADHFSDLDDSLNDLVATLYDRVILNQCIETEDPLMFRSLRIYMTRFSKSIGKVYIKQEKRKKGKSKNKNKDLVKIGMMRITKNSTSIPFNIFMLGLYSVGLAFLGLLIYIILAITVTKVVFELVAVVSFVILCVLGAFICLVGLMSEYIMEINDRAARWPGVIERERLNL